MYKVNIFNLKFKFALEIKKRPFFNVIDFFWGGEVSGTVLVSAKNPNDTLPKIYLQHNKGAKL